LSPLGPNGTDRYLFLLEDTMYQGPDTVFIISYRPRTGRKFDGLKGQLHVHTDGYALQHVIAEPADDHSAGMSAKLQQRFVRVPTGPHGTGPHAWFPDQLNTFLFFNFARVGSMKVIGVGRTYLQGIEVDVDVERREVRGAEFVMETLATRRDDDFWDSLRTDSLDDRELRTYHVIDSLSRAQGLEKRLRWLGHLLSGRAPVGPVDVLLDHVLRYNAHEGLRPGLGLATNDRVWRFASVGGHFAYGLRDTEWKYGGELTIKPWAGRGPQLRLYHLNDVEESGGAAFRGTPRTLDSEAYRLLYMDRMHRQERTGAELAFRVGSPLRLWLGTARTDRRDLLGYRHAVPLPAELVGDTEGVTLLHDAFLTGEVSIGLRYAFREQVAQLPRQQFGLGTRWPVLYVHVARAVPGLWGGDLDLWRADAMVEKTFHLRMLGDLSFRLQGGMAPADAPYPFLYNMRGTFGNGLLVAARNTFETMRPNEFTAHRYVALHLRHGFGGLLWKRGRSSPVLVLVANAGIGAPVRAERHRGHAVQGMEHGFAEAGLQVDRLLRIGFSRLGVGAFHRFGAYRFPDALDNIAVKLTLGIGL
ncbi:MAG: DUF5686 family protein, partial [Flavobacteriales bacterium]|nr:DUF5686 family protein [Flavobacteriales bacterium]